MPSRALTSCTVCRNARCGLCFIWNRGVVFFDKLEREQKAYILQLFTWLVCETFLFICDSYVAINRVPNLLNCSFLCLQTDRKPLTLPLLCMHVHWGNYWLVVKILAMLWPHSCAVCSHATSLCIVRKWAEIYWSVLDNLCSGLLDNQTHSAHHTPISHPSSSASSPWLFFLTLLCLLPPP